MLSFLTTLGGNALRTIIPAAVNWGMNKLTRSSFGKTYVAPVLSESISTYSPQTVKQMEQQEQAKPVERQIDSKRIALMTASPQDEWQDQASTPKKPSRKRKGILKRKR